MIRRQTLKSLLSGILVVVLITIGCSDSDELSQGAFELTLSRDSSEAAPGAILKVEVTIDRREFRDPIELRLVRSPKGARHNFPVTTEDSRAMLELELPEDAALGHHELTITAAGGDLIRTAGLHLSIVKQFTFEDHAPGRSGEMRELTVGDETLIYEVIDGLAILDGDMILGEAEEIEALAASGIDPQGTIMPERQCSGAWFWRRCAARWPDGRVPYAVDSGAWGNDADEMRTKIMEAISMWSRAVKTITFTEARASDDDYILFTESDGCSAHVGYRGGRQKIWLSTRCRVGSIAHEIGHALGLFHEHQRHDRDVYVEILEENIDRKKSNFKKKKLGRAIPVGEYDPHSIMHYPIGAFKKDSEPCEVGNLDGCTILPRSTLQGVAPEDLGQRDRLSPGDIAAVYAMYPGEPPTVSVARPFAGEEIPRNQLLPLNAEIDNPHGQEIGVTWILDSVEVPSDEIIDESYLPTEDLSFGAHEVVAVAADEAGNAATSEPVMFEVVSVRPDVDLIITDGPQPGGTTVVDTTLSFEGHATDPHRQDMADPEVPAERFEWFVGFLPLDDYTGSKSASHTFEEQGTHTVTVRVTGEYGVPREDSVEINVVEPVAAPGTAVIEHPEDGDLFFADGEDEGGPYAEVLVVGYANYGDGSSVPPDRLVWESSLNGELGTGRHRDVRLYTGTHTLTVKVLDEDGHVVFTSDSIEIKVDSII